MLSFHNDEHIKEKYVSRVKKHRELDNIIQGTGWNNGKGCAVGCTLENYDHSRYPIELGLPEWLAKLEDSIFEGLPTEDAILWPEKFLLSIPLGVDVKDVKHKLAISRMDRLINIQKINFDNHPELKDIFIQTISSLEIVKQCHESELNKSYCDWQAAESASWAAAESASWAAAESAAESVRSASSASYSAEYSVAYSEARSASWASWAAAESASWAAAESAAESVRSASSASYSAEYSVAYSEARSASWAARAAAESAAWKEEAELLLKLLSECN